MAVFFFFGFDKPQFEDWRFQDQCKYMDKFMSYCQCSFLYLSGIWISCFVKIKCRPSTVDTDQEKKIHFQMSNIENHHLLFIHYILLLLQLTKYRHHSFLCCEFASRTPKMIWKLRITEFEVRDYTQCGCRSHRSRSTLEQIFIN